MREFSATRFYLAGVIAVLAAGCASSTSPQVPRTTSDTSAPNPSETVVLTSPETTQPPETTSTSTTDPTPTYIEVPGIPPRNGDLAGVRVWQLPNSPDGDMPDQSWLAVGSDPSGNIFISGHDHVENSMLYRLDETTGMLNWVGDARSASEQVDNWRSTETAEKFHTRPTHHNGRIYVATLDRSSIDGAFYETRGFHWYAFDPADNSFVDLSAAEPDGVGAKHLQVVTIAPDNANNRIYGITIPENKVLYLDIEKQETTVVGKPEEWEGYFYSNRFMWTDSNGHLYFTGGTKRSQWNRGEDPRVLDTVWKYDPQAGFEKTDFRLEALSAIEVGQWDSERQNLYVSDDMGHIYRFTDVDGSWEYLGRPDFPAGETPSGNNKVWVFQLDPNGETIYLGRSDNFGAPNEIWQFDIASAQSTMLVELPDLDASAGSEDFITGYDSWDLNGNFYISAFSMYDNENAYLVGINPSELRAALNE